MKKFKWVALWLVLICVIVFILQHTILTVTEDFLLESTLGLPGIVYVLLQKPWTLITSMFLHGGVTHLLFNVIALALFGSILEKIIGWKRFLILYFVAGIVAGLGSAFLYDASLGASGAIFGAMGALGILRPKMVVYLGFIPMPMIVAVIFWVATNFLGLFFPGNIAYAGHLGGLIAGLIVGFYWKKDFGEVPIKKYVIRTLDEGTTRQWEDLWVR